MKKIIATEKAPSAIGPYSQGNELGNLIFTSGQLPVNPETGKIESNDITQQSHQSLDNLMAVLSAASGDASTVVKTTCYLADISDFAEFNKVYSEYFTNDFPARSCFAVKDLPLGAKIEIEAVAYKK
ncbi:RidA family protein [Vibrio sp. 10N.261.52.C2]|uniref:RidA family protein n=1 Tax=unclassified Vibrio TaxID=2614977 RepID=UPI003553DE4C